MNRARKTFLCSSKDITFCRKQAQILQINCIARIPLKPSAWYVCSLEQVKACATFRKRGRCSRRDADPRQPISRVWTSFTQAPSWNQNDAFSFSFRCNVLVLIMLFLTVLICETIDYYRCQDFHFPNALLTCRTLIQYLT